MKSREIRKRFFTFFTERDHQKVASSSLIPAQDPTLLFANAGMNQFKDVFLGNEKRSYTRAVTIQKCVRAGGKHNDLDNVGFTKRHLTFFEMMGNFSFGDYFKKEAIPFAWDFLTKELKLPTDNLYISVYETDDESFDIWHNDVGIPKEKIYRLGKEENFWQMGDTGPCGPSTEMHVDRGPEFGCKEFDQCSPACECDRFLEIWNLVFMQHDLQQDGSMTPLKKTGVDTGMGIERIASIMQNVNTVFETDGFQELFKEIETLTGLKYADQVGDKKAAFHVLSDHARSSSLLIADGCAPSNDGRGYVLRKIIRRAALFAQKLTDKNIFPQLAQAVIKQLGEVYSELGQNERMITRTLESEIEKFATNLTRGKTILANYFEKSKKDKVITGQQAFKLYDTYGFPQELIILMAKEQGYTVDIDGFEKHMLKQKQQSGKKMGDPLDTLELGDDVQSEFTGYNELETTGTIVALITNTTTVESVPSGEECFVIANKSPFFIVGGGQVPDAGIVTIGNEKTKVLEARHINGRIALRIKTPVALNLGDTITASVDPVWRTNAMKNHTGTHLLQAALIELFGKQIKQSGSLVHPDYLRFDFTYHENLSPEDIVRVENLVNDKIRQNIPVTIEQMTLAEATKKNIIAFFGDKYNPEKVRAVIVDDFSSELCGGTHVPATGVIGAIKITEVSALSAGHRRIVAVTGPRAIELFQESFATVKTLGQEFKVKREEVLPTVLKQKEELKNATNTIKKLKSKLLHAQLPVWQEKVETVGDKAFLFLTLKDYTHDELREIASALARSKAGLYFLTSSVNGRTVFLSMVSPQLKDTVDMKKFAAWLKDNHGLRGGGSPVMIQGGADKFDPQLATAVRGWLQEQ